VIVQEYKERVSKKIKEFKSKNNKLEKLVKKLEEEESFLDKPSKFPEAYQAALIEKERRHLFSGAIAYTEEKLELLSKSEQHKRDRFAKKYGRYLPKDLLPQLQKKAP
jgi:hypothetical protein